MGGDDAGPTLINGGGDHSYQRELLPGYISLIREFTGLDPNFGAKEFFQEVEMIARLGCWRLLNRNLEIKTTTDMRPPNRARMGLHRKLKCNKRLGRIKCCNCGEFSNHIAANCTLGPQPKRCYHCMSSGHLIAGCPKRRSRRSPMVKNVISRNESSNYWRGPVANNSPNVATSQKAKKQADESNGEEASLAGGPIDRSSTMGGLENNKRLYVKWPVEKEAGDDTIGQTVAMKYHAESALMASVVQVNGERSEGGCKSLATTKKSPKSKKVEEEYGEAMKDELRDSICDCNSVQRNLEEIPNKKNNPSR